MNLLMRLLAALTRPFTRPAKPSFADSLDAAMQEPFVAFSARSLERSMAIGPSRCSHNPTPNAKPATAGPNH